MPAYLGSPVRRHVFRIPRDVMFTTRELLNYGTRNTVDKVLSELVKVGYLIRLARGVFIREGSLIPPISAIACVKARTFGKEITSCSFSDHSLSEEGHIKHFKKFLKVEQKPIKRKRLQPYEEKESVGRLQNSQSKSNLNNYSRTSNDAGISDLSGLNDGGKEELIEITYLTTGCKSEFRCGNTIIRFKTACARKEKLTDDTKAARGAKKMWQIGRNDLTNRMINEITASFTKQDGMFFQRIRNWLPAWLGDKFFSPIYIDSPQYKYNYQQFYAVDPKTGWLVGEKVGGYSANECVNSIDKLKGRKQIRAA